MSAQGVDQHMINVYYYYNIIIIIGSLCSRSHWQPIQLECTCWRCVLPGPRSASTFSNDSENLALVQTLLLFCCATIERVIRYGITSSCGNLSVQSKSQLLRITSTASEIVLSRLYSLSFAPRNLWTDPSTTSTKGLLWCYICRSLRVLTAR